MGPSKGRSGRSGEFVVVGALEGGMALGEVSVGKSLGQEGEATFGSFLELSIGPVPGYFGALGTVVLEPGSNS